MQADWISYALQTTSAGQARYVVTSRMDPAESAKISGLFSSHALEAMRVLAGKPGPLWQLVGGGQGPAFLTRTTSETQNGTAVPVVWGLVLPPAYLAQPRVALQSLPALFPAPTGGIWPAPVQLGDALPEEPVEAALRLTAAYLEKAGQPLRGVPPPGTPQPVALLCQVVELLPPADRQPLSFATPPLGMRQLEVDPALPRGKGPQGGLPTLARLVVWQALVRVSAQLPAGVSLREPGSWLLAVLRLPDAASLLKGLYQRLAAAPMSAELREAAADEVQGALERRLAEAGGREAGALLAALHHNSLFAADGPFAQLWPARMAVESCALGHLPPDTLAAIFLPDAVPLLTNMDDGPAGARTMDLMTALAHLPAEAARSLRTPALQERLAELSALPRLENESDLAAALAALALYFKGGPDAGGMPRA